VPDLRFEAKWIYQEGEEKAFFAKLKLLREWVYASKPGELKKRTQSWRPSDGLEKRTQWQESMIDSGRGRFGRF